MRPDPWTDEAWAKIYSHAEAFLHEGAEAEDAVQAAALRVLSFGGEVRNLEALWYRATINLCKYWRRTHEGPPARTGRPREPSWIALPIDVPAKWGADRELELRELGERLERALATLAPPVREAVMLAYVDGRSYAEVGDMLGLGPSAVKMRLSRARAVLRQELAA